MEKHLVMLLYVVSCSYSHSTILSVCTRTKQTPAESVDSQTALMVFPSSATELLLGLGARGPMCWRVVEIKLYPAKETQELGYSTHGAP